MFTDRLRAMLAILLTVAFLGSGGIANAGSAAADHTVARVAILTGQKASEPELKAAAILGKRILKRSAVSVQTVSEADSKLPQVLQDAELVFVVGTPEGNSRSQQLIPLLGIKLPTLPNSTRIHPEGFAVKSGEMEGRPCVVIAGADPRGTIYGVGWVLRAMTYLPDRLVVPSMDAREKPALWMRGSQPSGPGGDTSDFGKLRGRSPEEELELMEDCMLLGTNLYQRDPEVMRPYGMMTLFSHTASEMHESFPKEWTADHGASPGNVCPSIPEARKALLDSFDKLFRESPDYDFFSTNSGDTGGCRCEKCSPWGGTYIKLVHEIADLLHKHHPNTKFLATNQDLDNRGNEQIIDYLNSQDSSWLFAIRYAPGADEMQTYIRGPVNPRWFEYEGFGPLGNYLKYLYRALPRTTTVSLYTDITHWRQSQYGVTNPDLALAAIYFRGSWNARPRNFHKVGREILHYAIGDMHYTEGLHDDFNKWFWYRMLWNPNQDAEAITREYCRYWFGPEAQDEAAQAIFLMEETLEKPVLGNPGIAKAVELLRLAGRKIPENLLRHDWRWRVMSQKALMDLYIQKRLERGEELKQQASAILQRIEGSDNPAAELASAVKLLDQPLRTEPMQAILDEALQRGEESNQAAGYREPVLFLVDKFDVTEVGWWKKTLQEALAGKSVASIKNAARMVLRYEDPGEGGFYDDLGWPNEPKRLVHGDWQWGYLPFTGPARRSHQNLAYTLFKPRGVTLKYNGLDPQAQYVVRLSVGVRIQKETSMLEALDLKEGLQADGQVISSGFPIPKGDTAYVEFDVPREVTKDGEVEIALTNLSKELPLTVAYEVWLMRKDKMPWTARP